MELLNFHICIFLSESVSQSVTDTPGSRDAYASKKCQKGLKTLIRPYIFRKKGGGQDSTQSSQVHKVPNLQGGSVEGGNFPQVLPCWSFEGFPYFCKGLVRILKGFGGVW